ncbi:MAG: hypothetical protein RDV41_16050, partial [Planctomycetota bacterium]|nr:hypothetical protein [Planctomycetota bacterium]
MARKAVSAVVALWLVCGAAAFAANSDSVLTVQGKLTDGSGNALTGTYDMVFRIYDGPAPGGTLQFEEGNPTPVSVSVTNGVYNVLVGETTGGIPLTVFQFPDLWFEIEVEGETLSPRTRLAAHAFAFSARMVGGYEPGSGSGQIPVSDTTLNTDLNADLLDSQDGSFYQDASNINAGVLDSMYGGTGFDASGLATGDILYNQSAASW